MDSIRRAIEVAKRQDGWQEGQPLIVWDSVRTHRNSGTRLLIEPGVVGGFRAVVSDGVGRAQSAHHPFTRDGAAERALDGYLQIVNNGI